VKLIVGLGNPGAEYERTRHNAGYMVIDHLVSRCAPGERAKAKFKSLVFEARVPEPNDKNELPPDAPLATRCLLMKPTTYMNLSGQAIAEAVRFYKLDPEQDVLVIVDDIALPCGELRLRAKGGAGGHNGLSSIQQSLGTSAYPRLRIGIDAPGVVPQIDYVLGKFSPEQQDQMAGAVPLAAACCGLWASEGATAAMNRFNAPDKPKPKKQKPEPTTEATGEPGVPGAGGDEPNNNTPNQPPHPSGPGSNGPTKESVNHA
jgi:PTH1 family peptidyl-tRNA hydrolase